MGPNPNDWGELCDARTQRLGGCGHQPRIASNYQELEEVRKDLPVQTSEGVRPCQYLHLGFLVSRTVRGYISVVLSSPPPPIVVILTAARGHQHIAPGPLHILSSSFNSSSDQSSSSLGPQLKHLSLRGHLLLH